MAFFKFRKGGDESLATPHQPESVEAMRRRAKHRLIGAAALVLIGVVGFPLLFDTQPRPIAVDIPIDIPDRNKVKPLALPSQQGAKAPVVSGPVTPPPAPVSDEKVATAGVPSVPAAIKTEAKADTKAESKGRPEAKASAKAEAADKAAADGRFVVQVGAFADAAKAREARVKVEKAGLKTYTHVAETKEGKRIRVRVGPFGTRADADKAADRIKGLNLPASILTL